MRRLFLSSYWTLIINYSKLSYYSLVKEMKMQGYLIRYVARIAARKGKVVTGGNDREAFTVLCLDGQHSLLTTYGENPITETLHVKFCGACGKPLNPPPETAPTPD